MKERFLKIWVAITAIFSVMATGALAADTTYLGNVTQVETLKNQTYVPEAHNEIGVWAGYVYNLTITSERVTNRWAGLAANVTGTILLADSASPNPNVFYEWKATPKYLFAVASQVVNWDTIRPTKASNVTVLEGTWLQPNDPAINYNDAYNNTFTNSETISSQIIPQGLYNYTTPQSKGSCDFKTYAAEVNTTSGHSNLLLIGKVTDYCSGYDGTQANVEMLLPEDGTNEDTSTTTYYLWVELW